MANFEHLKPGDPVIRMLGGKLPMRMVVREVSENLIVCDTETGFRGGWTFDRKTGTEEDHEIGWGVKFGHTGSYLTEDPVVS